MSELFSDENIVKPNFWKLEHIGDRISGVFVDKQVRDNTLKDPPVKQVIYSILQNDGTIIYVGGRSGNPQVVSGLEQCKLGQEVGLEYEKDLPPQKKGMQPAKILKVFKGPMKPEALQGFAFGSMTEVPPAEPVF